MKAPYYADLNPEYPSRYAKRWVVLYRYDGGSVRRVDQFATRRAAERCAERWNDAERDPEAPAWDEEPPCGHIGCGAVCKEH